MTGSPVSRTPASLISCSARSVVGRATLGGHPEQDTGGQPRAPGVQRGRPYAVVGGDPDDVDAVDLMLAQPLGERRAVVGDALEAAVGRLVLPLLNTASIGARSRFG